MKKTIYVFQTLFQQLDNLNFKTYDKVLQKIPTVLA